MKYLAAFLVMLASPVVAHTTTLPHVHDVSVLPMIAGVAVIVLALGAAVVSARRSR